MSELRAPLKFAANAPLPASAFPNLQPPVVRSVDDMPPIPPTPIDGMDSPADYKKPTVIEAQPKDPPKKKWYESK